MYFVIDTFLYYANEITFAEEDKQYYKIARLLFVLISTSQIFGAIKHYILTRAPQSLN